MSQTRSIAPSVYLVAGAPRSGTTLLQAILSHSKKSAPLLGEARFIRHFLEFYREVDRIWDDDARYHFENRAEAAEIARGALEKLFQATADRYSAKNLILKSPEFSKYTRELRLVLPTVRTFAILRDPKDIVALQLSASHREIELGFQPSLLPDSVPDPVAYLAARLLDYYPVDLLSNWHLIGYENLVSDPVRAVRKLSVASDLSITFDPGAPWSNVEFDLLRNSVTLERAWSSKLWGQPISDSRVGSYREILSVEQARRVDEICADYVLAWSLLSDLGDGPE